MEMDLQFEVVQNLIGLKQINKSMRIQKLENKIIDLVKKSEKTDSFSTIKSFFYMRKTLLLIGQYMVFDMPMDRKKILCDLSKIINCNVMSISYDMNELNSNKFSICLAGDYDYDSSVEYKKSSSLKVVWGNANCLSLKDLRYLENIEVICGNAYFNYLKRFNMPSLKYVFGDLHLEHLENLVDLKNLKLLGGKLYFQDKILNSLDLINKLS